MGAGDSKQESSSNYDLSKAGGEAPQELPRDLHQGPIHSLAVADRHHLLTGGADKVKPLAHPATLTYSRPAYTTLSLIRAVPQSLFNS